MIKFWPFKLKISFVFMIKYAIYALKIGKLVRDLGKIISSETVD